MGITRTPQTPARTRSDPPEHLARPASLDKPDLLAWLRTNFGFVLLFGSGAVLMALAMAAYQPSLPLNQDAFMYVERSATWSPSGSFHPFLYPVLLKPLLLANDLAWVVGAQHLAALAIALMLYLLLRRLEVAPLLAALGVAPFLFDAYQLNIEHHVLSETFCQLFIVAGLVTLAWSERPDAKAVALGGALIGLSALVRFPGLAAIVAAGVYLVLRRAGWMRLLALAIGFLLPIGVYGVWFRSHSGSLAITNRDGFFLYGRVVSFADCEEVHIPARLRVFCPENRSLSGQRGLFTSGLPDRIRRDPSYNSEALGFSRRMILAKPASYVAAVASDFLMYFQTTRPDRREPGARKWVFPRSVEQRERRRPAGTDISVDYRADPTLAPFLNRYQRAAWTYGPLVAALLVLGGAGILLGRRSVHRRGLAPECGLFTLAALGLMLFPTVFGVYHVRYVLPALPLVGPAGALGAQALISRFRGRDS